ncbi:unnamed protein product [Allacma fusca]|uniref:Uncharacterized protein n=1 Tax=Allacma fusca TaxID=39272 RepID=A0A8J2K0P1_9HEXA|nr:unnamed protein product [Allacma fusca]
MATTQSSTLQLTKCCKTQERGFSTRKNIPGIWKTTSSQIAHVAECAQIFFPKYEYLGNTSINLTEVLMHHRFSQIIESSSVNESKGNFNQQAETPPPSLHRCKHFKQLKENTTETSQFTSMTAFIQGNQVIQYFRCLHGL